jgi:hypothetical protein
VGHTTRRLLEDQYQFDGINQSVLMATLQPLYNNIKNYDINLISCFCISKPPISEYDTSGLSPSLNIEILESASGGKTSTIALECRCKAIDEEGFNVSRSIVDKMLYNKFEEFLTGQHNLNPWWNQ